MLKFFLLCIAFTFVLGFDNTSYVKQKQEIQDLKKDLNAFYTKKDKEYKKKQKQLEDLLLRIQKDKKAIQNMRNEDKKLLKQIAGKIKSKTSDIYNKMSPKVAAKIFDKMIKENKLKSVFAILIKLKDKQITAIMKYLDVNNAAQLTQMLRIYKID